MPVFTFVAGIVLLLLGISTPVHPNQYYFIKDLKTWTDAQSYCRQTYTDLATIDNMEDMKRLSSAAPDYVGGAWVGLRMGGPAKWVWSDGSQNFSYTNWAKLNPSFKNGDCVAMDELGQWYNGACGSELFISCYDNTRDDPIFVVHPGVWTWYSSQRHCKDFHTEMSVVTTQAQNNDIQHLAEGNWVWIGLSRDYWSWSDGSNTTFRYWQSGAPNNDGRCGLFWLDKEGGFDDWDCGLMAPFFCEETITTKTLMTVKISILSDVDLTDQVVSDQLQEQLEIELKKQNPNFQVNWKIQEDGQVFKLAEDEGSAKQSAGCETLDVWQYG